MIKEKYPAVYFVKFCGLLLVCLLGNLQSVAEANDPLQQLIKAKPAAKPLKFSAPFHGRGDGVHTCPVTGERVTNKSLKAEYFGRTVYFCCHGCLKAAEKNPEKFVKATIAEQQTAAKAYMAKSSQAPSGDGAEFCND